MSLTQAVHRQNVRKLYKTILRLHRGLPQGIKELGDKYVQDEFRLHKAVNNGQHIQRFMVEWTDYAVTLSKQLSSAALTKSIKLGRDLPEEKLDAFTDDQLMQLLELKTEVEKSAAVSESSDARKDPT